MHGLICKSVEGFVIANHGTAAWERVRRDAGLPFERFETMRLYEDGLLEQVVAATAARLDRKVLGLIEDVAHWVCVHPPLEPVRRLIRFTGATFEDLILALDEIEDRARMAVPDLELPSFRVRELGPDAFHVDSEWTMPGASAMLTGVLRAMSDDYGCLAVIESAGFQRDGAVWREAITIHLVAEGHHPARRFDLGAGAA
ncbi:heme NO-binding domain-containing protein [Jannaschia ovalis]|uniref:Heme NO-binding domain-containing protein n=1 Tax=Jannaschia ovalis TaxID=3038773 RepID=A0ABY8LC87_9RHOB|nr:heme NO-binding domain-containing protein [Jannaschia sp. GRR-S6-38]WGH78941.1 heme NO-binding domain-containing protein [Jannaschia sp. GRR-S6-38]